MEKITLWHGYNIYHNEDIVIAEINFKMYQLPIIKNKWNITDITDTTIPEPLRPKTPVTTRNDGTGQIWLKIKTDGYLDVYSTTNWTDEKEIPLRATMVWRKK